MKLYEFVRLDLGQKEDKRGFVHLNNPDLCELVSFSRITARMKLKKKQKEPKGNADEGKYCPKEKTGQAWSHIKDTKKEEVDETLSDDTQN